MKNCRTGFFCLCLLATLPGRAQQQPPDSQQTNPGTQPPAVPPPPELPKYPDVRQLGETGFFFGASAWFPKEHPLFDKGRESGLTNSSFVTFQGTPKLSEGLEFGVAAGLHNTLRITFDEAKASGNFTAPNDLSLITQTYSAGTYMSTAYTFQHLKLSYEYLTWPYPVESRRFRLKTLWQVQYVSMKIAFDAPNLPLVDTSGNPIVDVNGNPVSYAATATRWYVSPTFGLGLSEYVTRHLRLELNGSGFAIPRHTDIWDADASANLRIGHFELRAGAKSFHFKTSTALPYYMRNTMTSAFFGIRWYSE